MAVFDTRNDAEYGMGLSATLSGTTKASGKTVDMIFMTFSPVVTSAGRPNHGSLLCKLLSLLLCAVQYFIVGSEGP